MTEPVNRTILLFDIEKFGQRDDVEQTFMRRMLHTVVEDTLTAAGVEPTAQHREDRGDCVMALISPEIAKPRLLRALLTQTPTLLHANNRLAAASAQVRLRIVVASGEVALHPQPGTLGGAVGHDLNQAFRLLDADPLRAALRERSEQSVLCVSDSVYQGVVRHGHPGLRPEEFHEISVRTKEGSLTGWLCGPVPPEHARPQQEPPRAAATEAAMTGAAAAGTPGPGSGATFAFNGGSPSFGGGLVGGDQHGVSGGQVTGDVVMGGKTTERRESP
ncbi:nucleotidyl cyclase domain-containing protein [Streptomyces varsoviensis]|uniref:aromatic ring-opening dioxygenase LigA n=1 Tax=Streptomyces varsoviensis TaxID=67373 RepID=UPI0004CA175F|nr:aromatic ring-opening dioxygenase LigA [Streptomyces varsoviensis]